MKEAMMPLSVFFVMSLVALLGYYAGVREAERKSVGAEISYIPANIKIYGADVGRCQLTYDAIELAEFACQLKID